MQQKIVMKLLFRIFQAYGEDVPCFGHLAADIVLQTSITKKVLQFHSFTLMVILMKTIFFDVSLQQ